jgi:hypothetical protein
VSHACGSRHGDRDDCPSVPWTSCPRLPFGSVP